MVCPLGMPSSRMAAPSVAAAAVAMACSRALAEDPVTRVVRAGAREVEALSCGLLVELVLVLVLRLVLRLVFELVFRLMLS